ncbi:chemotaxis protein CheB [Dactylosporangium sp. NPDC051541]|uniref:chemotaxis protein CheB n=1 Tax=Dactylosporangium sp. NPDC051541 TaxID=3363977 RepID=UPI00379B0240
MTEDTVAHRDLVVVGGSAGGLDALCRILADLPADLPAAVLVVLHIPSEAKTFAADVLGRCGPLPASPAVDGEPIEPGRIYTPVPDRHLLVHGGLIRLSRSAKQNRARPAVDALFRSAARWYGARAVGVVLSGVLDDGAAGLAAIAQAGGAAIVQDPLDAMYAGMPSAALAVTPAAQAAATATLGAAVDRLVREPVAWDGAAKPDPELVTEVAMAESERAAATTKSLPGRPVGISCPDCTGGMRLVGTAPAIHYLCHVGHSWSPHTLIAAQQEKVEAALWTAVSMLEEQAHIHRDLANRAAAGDAGRTVAHQLAAADEILGAAAVIRKHFPELLPEELRWSGE